MELRANSTNTITMYSTENDYFKKVLALLGIFNGVATHLCRLNNPLISPVGFTRFLVVLDRRSFTFLIICRCLVVRVWWFMCASPQLDESSALGSWLIGWLALVVSAIACVPCSILPIMGRWKVWMRLTGHALSSSLSPLISCMWFWRRVQIACSGLVIVHAIPRDENSWVGA